MSEIFEILLVLLAVAAVYHTEPITVDGRVRSPTPKPATPTPQSATPPPKSVTPPPQSATPPPKSVTPPPEPATPPERDPRNTPVPVNIFMPVPPRPPPPRSDTETPAQRIRRQQSENAYFGSLLHYKLALELWQERHYDNRPYHIAPNLHVFHGRQVIGVEPDYSLIRALDDIVFEQTFSELSM